MASCENDSKTFLPKEESTAPQGNDNLSFAPDYVNQDARDDDNIEMKSSEEVGNQDIYEEIHLDTEVHQKAAPDKSTNCKTTFNCCETTFLMLGTLSAVMAFSMLVGGYQAMFDAILKSQLEITPGSRAYDIWRLTPVPLFLHVYFFSITNPRAFKLGLEKANLEEVGPYCYREYHEKQNLTFHDNNTVTFFQERWWVWDQECSGNNTKDDIISTLNTIPVSAAWSVRNILPARESLNQMMNDLGEELIVEATASEIMFEGVKDPLLDWIQETLVPENSTFHNITHFLPPGITDYDKFAWFYGRNHSLLYDGLFNMRTGQDTLDTLGELDLWNHNPKTSFFDPPCNRISGSAGEMWPPNLKKDYIEFYSSDLCSTMRLDYKEEAVDPHGLKGNRYWGSKYTFSNGSTLPGNECFCVKGTCAPYGLLNAESCRMGSPAFISFPHFFNADQFLLHQVKGMAPDEDKHAFFMDLIPELGTPMNVAARMQINLFVRPYKDEKFPGLGKIGGIDILKNVHEVYLPLMWFEELAGIPDDMAGQLKAVTYMMTTNIMQIIFGVMLALGILTIGIVLVAHHFKTKKSKLQATVGVHPE